MRENQLKTELAFTTKRKSFLIVVTFLIVSLTGYCWVARVEFFPFTSWGMYSVSQDFKLHFEIKWEFRIEKNGSFIRMGDSFFQNKPRLFLLNNWLSSLLEKHLTPQHRSVREWLTNHRLPIYRKIDQSIHLFMKPYIKRIEKGKNVQICGTKGKLLEKKFSVFQWATTDCSKWQGGPASISSVILHFYYFDFLKDGTVMTKRSRIYQKRLKRVSSLEKVIEQKK